MKTGIILFLLSLLPIDSIFSQVIRLNGDWKFHIGDRSGWSATDYQDGSWESIRVPAHWEDEGFNGYDGFAWYRKSFDGTILVKEENYYLNVGFIDDCDEVYLNGVLVGLSGSMPPKFKTAYNTERKYTLPSELINFKGMNSIAIRVYDVTQGGGVIDGKLGIYRSPKSRMLVDLQGLWSFTTSKDWQPIKDDREWKKIMVPSNWERQGYSRYDGFAWYRKTFTLDIKSISNDEDLVLLLGKIDDFDRTYLNGKQIGKTHDGQPYGESRSFDQLRVYTIPIGWLKKDGLNTIEVMVEDMGNDGGIYQGPVGITTRTSFERYYR